MLKKLGKGISKFNKDFKNTYKYGYRLHKVIQKEYLTGYSLYFVLAVVVTVTPYLFNYVQGLLIDELIGSVEISSFTSKFRNLLIVLISAAVISQLAGNFLKLVRELLRQNVRLIFVRLLLFKYANLDLSSYEDPKVNDKLQRAEHSYNYVPFNFLANTFSIVTDLTALVLSFYILLNFSPTIAAIIFVSSLPRFFSEFVYYKASWNLERKESPNFRDYYASTDYVQSEKSLQELWVFNLKDHITKTAYDKFKKVLYRFLDLEWRLLKLDTVGSIFNVVGIAITYFLLSKAVVSGAVSIGLFTFYIQTTRGFSNSMASMISYLSAAFGKINYMKDIFDVLDIEKKIKSGRHKLAHSLSSPTIEFKNVWFKYPKTDRYVFKNLNFKIAPGDNIAIVGKNGAGKSTFVKLLCRFYDVSKGQILINGIDIKKVDLKTWYAHLALLSQDFNRYHYNAKTNIKFGNINSNEGQSKIEDSAKQTGAHEFIKDEFKKGYNQVLSKRFKGGIEPSVGQWQKIALARAFYKSANVLVLDEPTSAIDPKAEYEIFNNIFKEDVKDKKQDKTIVIISHRFSTVRTANKIIVLEKGKIIEEGTHEELLKVNGVYKEAFDLQKKGYQ